MTLQKELRAAAIPFVLFLACATTAIWNHDTYQGSATSGEIRENQYWLSMGHGAYQQTDPATFASIKQREHIVHGCLAGMLVSGAAALLFASRARFIR
jgi:hypothetical protein